VLYQLLGKLKNTVIQSGAIDVGGIGGAITDKNDPWGRRRADHASQYYDAVRQRDRKNEIRKIANNSGIDKGIVGKAYDHLSINEHELSGETKCFDPDYNIAQSWQRLADGKNIQQHDLMLLRHEAMEHDLMQDHGMSYRTAHDRTVLRYDYPRAVAEFLRKP
jgi:hypothetical protein